MPIYNENVSDDLDLTEDYESPEDVSDSLALSESVAIVNLESVSSDLALTDSIADTHSMGLRSSLGLTETYASNVEAANAVVDSLDLTDSIGLWVERSSGGAVPCEADYNALAALQSVPDVRFSAIGEDDVVIRAPEFGNTLDLDTGAVVRHTRGGQYSIIRPDEWPVVRVMKLKFVSLTNALKAALTTFLSNTSGKLIGYRDHENVAWEGVVLDQGIDFKVGKGDCTNEVAITFRGKRT